MLKKKIKSLLGASLALGVAAAVHAEERPNILFILCDDMGCYDPSFRGANDLFETPALDSIAAEGVYFDQGYVSASVCGPSRSGLVTGIYQQKFGMGENPNEAGWPENPKFPMAGIPLDVKMISEYLQPAGYHTGYIGKWHLGMNEALRPNSRGYDYWFGFLNGAHSFIKSNMEFTGPPQFWPTWKNDEIVPHDGYYTDMFTDEGVKFIERNANKEEPFFLFMSYNAPHAPWQMPENVKHQVEHIEDSKKQVYAGMVVSMDNGIQRLLDSLKEQKIYDNTLVVFLSDNGAPRDSMATNADLKGFKGSVYEGGLRVPFLMSWPKQLKGGQQYDHPVSSLDLVPTILEITGTDDHGTEFDGMNIMPYITGEKNEAPRQTFYWRRDDNYAIREGDWKLTFNNGRAGHHAPILELFNIAEDPTESKDLSQKMPEKVQMLQTKFDSWDSVLPDSQCWGAPHNRKKR
ncbi:sulfatase family protein [Persicirhabdus sediminis]|uniref:Sulfatase-like hydrolase/transferase n=1 Tax=Persicirhabdus sediminis TaxID=454144 RepID=A0A8J7MBE1_9BACT|nr:sulfatase-like hydrolase/transferase [Persicirhabdus sediminis]MBK1790449.1 sulfatase-like hydrolase/transferase [Persicirhabdus sediminis]